MLLAWKMYRKEMLPGITSIPTAIFGLKLSKINIETFVVERSSKRDAADSLLNYLAKQFNSVALQSAVTLVQKAWQFAFIFCLVGLLFSSLWLA